MRRRQQVDRRTGQRPKKLRKQPKMRRVQSATSVAMPPLTVPKTAARRRKRNNRRQKGWYSPLLALKKIIFSARWISLGLLSACVYALVLSGLSLDFYLTLIPVEGSRSIPPAEIVAASGLAGSHVFAADPNVAAQHIAELPGVISATVTLGWPNEVMIQIKEDSPIAVWQEGGRQFWITRDGRLIPSRSEVLELPLIVSEMSLVAEAVAQVDENTAPESVPQTSLAFVPLSILEGVLELRELQPNVSQFYYRPSGGLSFDDERGWRAYFGTGTDMKQKNVVYQAIVADLQARQLAPEYISVSNQQKPYYMAR